MSVTSTNPTESGPLAPTPSPRPVSVAALMVAGAHALTNLATGAVPTTPETLRKASQAMFRLGAVLAQAAEGLPAPETSPPKE